MDEPEEGSPDADGSADEASAEHTPESDAERPDSDVDAETGAEKPTETAETDAEKTTETAETDAEKITGTDTAETAETDAEKPAATAAEKTTETDAAETAETDAEKTTETDAEKPAETDAAGTDDTDGTAETDTGDEDGTAGTDGDGATGSDAGESPRASGDGEGGEGGEDGGLTRVDPPEDVPHPEKPPRDDDTGGLRRVDAEEGAGNGTEDGDSAADPAPESDVGHGAHPAEHHEPVTGDTGRQPAGHSDGVPSPGDDEYEDWLENLRDQNPDPVPEPEVDTTPEEEDGVGAVAGPAPAPEPESDPDPDSTAGDGRERSPPWDEDTLADPDSEPDREPGPGGAPAPSTGTDTGTGSAPDAPESVPSPAPAAGAAPGDGVGTVPSTPGPGDPDFGSVEEPAAPPDDEEMPLAEHIEEMVRRLVVVIAAAGLATALAFPSAEALLNAMWYGVLPANVPSPTLYGPLEKLLSEIKVASLAGILIALPVLVYEAYVFMRPGLYPNERRYFLAAVPTSLVLGSLGMAFAYFLILPLLFSYFITYSESAVDALPFGLQVTFDLMVSLLGAFAVVFQIPLLIMLAVMIGVVTRRWLEQQRLLFWGLFLGVGFFISLGDATGTAPIIIALTMISLFEGTLALLRWTGRN
jgi:sec-independent protein translocase protein TatC